MAKSARTRWTGAPSKAQILDRTEREKVRFMRLQFTDILGINKNVEVPPSQFEKALAEGDKKVLAPASRETVQAFADTQVMHSKL